MRCIASQEMPTDRAGLAQIAEEVGSKPFFSPNIELINQFSKNLCIGYYQSITMFGMPLSLFITFS